MHYCVGTTFACSCGARVWTRVCHCPHVQCRCVLEEGRKAGGRLWGDGEVGLVHGMLSGPTKLTAESAGALAAVLHRHAEPLGNSLKFGALLLATITKCAAEVCFDSGLCCHDILSTRTVVMVMARGLLL